MVAAGAFTQVQQSLRWFVDNFTTIANWRATLLRVMAFRDGLSNLKGPATLQRFDQELVARLPRY